MEKQKLTNQNQNLSSYIFAILLKIIINYINYLIFAPLFLLLIIAILLTFLQFAYIIASIIIIIFKSQTIQLAMSALDFFNQPYQLSTSIEIDPSNWLKIYLIIIAGITFIDLFLQRIFKFRIMDFFNSIKIKSIIIFFAILLGIQIIINIYFKTYEGILAVFSWCIISILFITIFLAVQRYFSRANQAIDKELQKYHAN